MKTLTTLSLMGALALSSTAFAADPKPHPGNGTPSAAQQCRTEKAAMGIELFRETYGANKNKRNAFGKCVSKRRHATHEAAKQARRNASKECTAEEQADPAAFAQKYGTDKPGADAHGKHGAKAHGKHHSHAHGKCVSQKVKAETATIVAAQVAADVSAAKACDAERTADPAAFAAKYGSNKNKRNAFGKCVSTQAKALQDDKS